MKNKCKPFAGFGFELLSIRATNFYGYGLSLFQVTISSRGRLCTSSKAASLFHFTFIKKYDQGGIELVLNAGVFFTSAKIWSRVIAPKKDVCDNCGHLCQTKEFYQNGKPYCCYVCQDWIEFQD